MSAPSCTAERPGDVQRRLPPVPASVSEARRLVRDLLHARGREDLEDTAALLVSEVVTNALLHAGTTIVLTARLEDRLLRVEVGDGSPHLPVPRRYASTAGTGRGLRMVERLVDDWGVTRHDEGKTVWFTLSDGERTFHGATAFSGITGDSGEGPAAADVVEVELRGMPLLLHAAWQEHVEALLRELLLARLDEEAEEDVEAIALHAEATDAVAFLAEHVPAVDVGLDADALMEGATEPFVSAERVVLPLPSSSVASFDTLERAILQALDLSTRGRTFAPPTQPEIQEFRSWLCEQVRSQVAGAAPVRWRVDHLTPSSGAVMPSWDLSAVSSATTGRIAADEDNRIVAVSAAAAELLGYADPWDLVGRRLVAIIPDRYRQAHVAGFTLFQLTGRRPLLDRAVEVPARHADGREVPVSLLVRTERGEDGRRVFVADIAPAG